LQAKAVAYLNVDVAVSGANFGASSVTSLWKLIRAATRDVPDPKTGKSLYTQWQERTREERPEAEKDSLAEARIGALGSGSDYTPFLQHLGIPSTDMGFGGDYGVYHSAFDSFYWMSHFGDPTFVYHAASAQLWGTMAMRLAAADGLPFDYTDYANQIRDFFAESVKIAKRRNLGSAFDEKAMNDALKDFADAAAHTETVRRKAVEEKSAAKLRRINDGLMAAERDFIEPQGLRGRPWYKHQIYAPGINTGYAAQPLTDFSQALDDRNSENTRASLEIIIAAVRRATATLKKSTD
jgi:N-acetylated-alpha-linked acidic dipeptidase